MRPTQALGATRKAISSLALIGLLGLSLVMSAAAPLSVARDDQQGATPSRSAVTLSPARGPIGSITTLRGNGFAANASLDVLWQDWDGSWDASGGGFKARVYKERMTPLTQVRADASGAFEARVEVPQGFGFEHQIVVAQGGERRATSAFFVEMQARMTPRNGPPGTLITMELKGVGVQPRERDWVVLYDNQFAGWMSAVTTNGTATGVITATGGPGRHILEVFQGPYFPDLNAAHSPDPARPTWTFEFTVTDGQAILPPPPEQQGPKPIAGAPPKDAKGPVVWLDPASGYVGMDVTVRGSGLPANADVRLDWQTNFGPDPVVAGGIRAHASFPVVTGKTAADGTLRATFKVPEDVGRVHPVVLMAGEQSLATGEFKVRPKANFITPASGPVGTDITINLKGVDDTDTGKIFIITYDNAWTGYACSVTSQGDITIHIPASGKPGWHFINLYPGMYEPVGGQGMFSYEVYDNMEEFYIFRVPQLTYLADHPNEKDIPAFRFAFFVTGETK